MPNTSLGLLADAAALQESGILVAGMCVTDLSTGYQVMGEPPTRRPDYLDFSGEQGDIRYKGSPVSLAKLEELLELVEEVRQQRRDNPEAATMNPPVPRTTFPYGVGMAEPDVLVTGHREGVIVAFLRQRGIRARVLDARHVLGISGQLAALSSSATPPSGHTPDPSSEGQEIASVAPDERPIVEPSSRGLAGRVAVLAALVLVLVGGVAAGWVVFRAEPVAEDMAVQAEAAEPAAPVEGDGDEAGGDVAPEEKEEEFHDHRKAGGEAEAPAERAAIPMSVGVPGWRLVGAKESQEEFRSDDAGMRVLVAAKPTPLGSQAELDKAMREALEAEQGVRLVTFAPVSYREDFPESTTVWHVRLVEGHQVSVGCQYRQITVAREAECARVVETARPEL
ncbi:MAG TPA: type VII secretion-associated protein [Candidatus Corynebacterium gallistercoris]|uniref:Type VII secretion-associated protein n=1 Tax=Candidatus Corynebacterium gallistercoris TaxID=2838530 RepID=A0A9D1UQI6_9CORY|nr:type VII secretion-associated protein [Candidatus Corynebacterium gallistercoris]